MIEGIQMGEGQGAGLASVVNKDGWAGGRLLGLLPATTEGCEDFKIWCSFNQV